MTKITQLIYCCLFCTITLNAQEASNFQLSAPNDPLPYAETITQEDMRSILTILSADDMEGRETGTPGNDKAAEYIASQLAASGIPKVEKLDSYFQNIAFTSELWEDIALNIKDKPFRHLWDFYTFANLNTSRTLQNIEEVVFLGYGIDDSNYSDYKGKDVKGKTILIYDGEPTKNGVSYITKSKTVSDWTTDRKKKLATAYKNGVSTVLIIDGNLKQNLGELRGQLLDGRMKMGAAEKTLSLIHI